LGNSRKERLMEKEGLRILMEVSRRELGSIMFSLGKELSSGLMEGSMRGIM